ncbi:MAG TPA: hypothetical protein VN881_14050 [Candidatus Acidoferrales bacterium]|nr:hypothetical protein [Candidatus Acidoferrales bacterium]
MAPKRQKVVEPKERKDKEKEKDFKDKDFKDIKELKDSDVKNFKDKEKDKDFKDHSKEVKDSDAKNFKDKEHKDFKEIKEAKDSDAKNFKDKEKELDHKPVKESDKWIGENFPVDPGGPVEGGTTLAQLARRVANLEAILAKGRGLRQSKGHPAAGKKTAKKRGG